MDKLKLSETQINKVRSYDSKIKATRAVLNTYLEGILDEKGLVGKFDLDMVKMELVAADEEKKVTQS